MDSSASIQVVCVFIGVAICVSTTEMIWSWKQIRGFIHYSKFLQQNCGQTSAFVFGLLVLRLLLAACLFAFPLLGRQTLWPLITVTIVSLVLSYYRIVGNDGSDQLQNITLISLSVAEIASSPVIDKFCLYFLAFQLILAYTTAGLAKALSPYWRSGVAIGKILNTYSYGSSLFGPFLLRHSALNRILTYAPIILLTTFCLPFLTADPIFLWVYIAIGFTFHLGNAIAMGLNNFFFTFPSLYATLVFTHRQLYGGY